jgi:hypothetical protein
MTTVTKENACLVVHNNPSNTFWVPEELIDIVVTNNFVVILFPPDKLAILNLVTLVANEPESNVNDRYQRPDMTCLYRGLMTARR